MRYLIQGHIAIKWELELNLGSVVPEFVLVMTLPCCLCSVCSNQDVLIVSVSHLKCIGRQ